jgi:hypothetical protein
MNLETLVDRACLESGYNDTDDVAAAQKFARHWDEHIWNSALWKDSLVVCDVAVTPSTNDDHADGIVFLPEVIDRVVAVRTSNNQIVIRGQEHYYRMDFDSFAATGTPIEFNILPPAWVTLYMLSTITNPTAGQRCVIRTIDASDGTETLRIRFQIGTQPIKTLAGTVPTLYNYIYANSESQTVTVFGLQKPTTTNPIRINGENVDDLYAELAAADTCSPRYQRLRLLPIPTADFTLKVLGKAKYEPLDFDQQEPALRNCTNALLAFIRGSLKRRGGENAAAQMEFQEANALLKQVEQIEALQAANNSRFMPEDGYAPEHGIGPN